MIPELTGALIGVFVLLFFFALLGLRYYLRRVQWVAEGVQHVDTSRFGFPDLMIGGVLAFWFSMMVFAIMSSSSASDANGGEITVKALLDAIMLHGVLVGGIIISLQTRRISVLEIFGLRKLSLKQAGKIAFIALVAAWPVIKIITALTALILGEQAEAQSVITFFNDSLKNHQWLPIATTVLTGAVVAPIAEEFVFRGYLYGVAKRYAGPLAATLFTAALFAAIHFNALSLPSLFVLAICFTLLYEITGSLAVPMIMHALFNSSSLVEMLILSRVMP